MAQLTLVLNILKHDLVLQLGAGISPEDDDSESKELIVVESSAETERAPVGFTVQHDDEEDEDGLSERRIY